MNRGAMKRAGNAAAVSLSEIAAKNSWSPRDFIFQPGTRIVLTNPGVGTLVVVMQHEDGSCDVAAVECVPGTTAEFACSMPFRVGVMHLKEKR